MSAKNLGKAAYGGQWGLRPETMLERWAVQFIFNTGGMGDFVNYAAATQWLAINCPWLVAKVFVPRYLVPLFKDIHAVNPSWAVIASEEAIEHFKEGTAFIGPDIFMNGVNRTPQFLTCVGAHPVDVGFAYYAGTTPPPPDGFLPVLDYSRKSMPDSVQSLGDYIVIPTGNVQESRKTTGRHLNPIIDYVVELGLTPVFLGKLDLLGDGRVTTKFPNDVDYHRGLDLRDRTTIKQAAAIMQHAKATVALDCGLLHLAALMKDSRLVFGYNITSVVHREPRRKHGKHVNVTLTEEQLKCAGCQSKLKQIAVHKFDKCLYGDNQCIEVLFRDDSKLWKDAINEVISA